MERVMEPRGSNRNNIFFHLEELFVQAVQAGVPYSSMQLLDTGLDNVKKTGLFITAVVEWNGFDPGNKSWYEFKAHFTEGYEARLDSGPTAATTGYHGAAMALADDNNSLGSIAGLPGPDAVGEQRQYQGPTREHLRHLDRYERASSSPPCDAATSGCPRTGH